MGVLPDRTAGRRGVGMILTGVPYPNERERDDLVRVFFYLNTG